MAAATQIGRGACPVCKNSRARFAVSSKQLCCMTCDACNLQIFSRSDRSDELMRYLITSGGADADIKPKPKPEPVETPAQQSATPEAPKAPAPAEPANRPANPPAAPRVGWGFLKV